MYVTQKELVSVIITLYNKEPYIKDCILSALGQTYNNIEVVIIDDGSTDGSLAVCREVATHDDRIRIISQENRGVSFTRNRGISVSRGEYICFLDADDCFDRNYVESMVSACKNNDCAISTCEVIRFYDIPSSETTGIASSKVIEGRLMIKRMYQSGGMAVSMVGNKVFKR